MFKYEYVALKGKKLWISDFAHYQGTIDEYAKKGFRYVGYMPTQTGANGELYEIQLIFEIEERC